MSNLMRGSTYKPRLFIPSTGTPKLGENAAVIAGTPKDLTGYTAQIAAVSTLGDLVYKLDPLAGTITGGNIDFNITDELMATMAAGAYTFEIMWVSGTGETTRYQFTKTVDERVIDDPVAPATSPDPNITTFNGHDVGRVITIADQGFTGYFVEILPLGNHAGKIGDITVSIDSATQFTVYNWGSSRGSFTWRIRR